MSSYCILFLVGFVVLCVLPESIVGVCMDTGCQHHSAKVRGCGQYGMRAVATRSCNPPVGTIYTCCS
uniref:Secreted peptide n=1 Tax=Pristhesancus plagipennis TaxID=1955184 RepID=A0A2K8JWP3_PRIPG|nr:secreted peptide [Pristhesancus plagipennis]